MSRTAHRLEGIVDHGTDGNQEIRLTRCPVCGLSFGVHGHADGAKSPSSHLRQDHTPSDFGLTPMGGERDE
jgi:hypothetical protein